jgi:hypothetical protein
VEAAQNVRVVPRRDVAKQSLGDGAVLVDLRSGTCFELNRTGAEVWDLLAGGATIDIICATLAGRYGVPDETIAGDVRSVVEALKQQELVEFLPVSETP